MAIYVKRNKDVLIWGDIVIDMNTKENERIYRWRAHKNAQGWRFVNLLLPPDVKDKVMVYKQTLMAQYRNRIVKP